MDQGSAGGLDLSELPHIPFAPGQTDAIEILADRHRILRETSGSEASGRVAPGITPWSSHRSGSVKQETHLVTSPRPTSQVPIIGFSALLQLVEWCHVRRQRGQQGGPSCVDPEPPLSPPAPDRSSPSPGSAPVLADVDRRIPTANPGHPQSDRGPAARTACSWPGGEQ
jgi:hypothetical protein